MFPYFNKTVRLHYFGDESILINHEEPLFFNHAETMLLEKINGCSSTTEIVEKISKEIQSNEVQVIYNLFLDFIEREELKNVILIDSKPHENNLIISGKKGYKYPLNILLELTNKCNLKCVHCYKEAGYNKKDEISSEKLLEKLSSLSEHVYDIQLSGGEPMTHRKFADIVSFVKENFKTSSITTAATLITPKNVQLLKGISNVQVSLYSGIKEKHDLVTLVPNSFEKTLTGIKLLSENNIYTTVSTIVTSENIDEIEILVKKAIEVGANEIKFGEFSRSGRGLTLSKKWELNEEQTIQANEIITNLRLKYRDNILIGDWEDDKTTDRKMDYNHGGFSCGAGNLSWTITENGNIRPCVFLPENKFTTGNIFDNDLDMLLKKHHIQNLYTTLGEWENELNSVNLSTKKVCPVMSNYLDAFEEYNISR
jgi:radical SAM protein with 4Fe4S-binding SPASM domain